MEVSSSLECGFSWFYYAQTTASDVYIPCIHLSMQDTSSIYLHALNTPSTTINSSRHTTSHISQHRCSYGGATVCVLVREYVQSLLICTVSQVAKSRNMQSLAICKLIYKVLQSAKSLKLRSCLGWRCGASCACLFLFCVVARCDFFDVEQLTSSKRSTLNNKIRTAPYHFLPMKKGIFMLHSST